MERLRKGVHGRTIGWLWAPGQPHTINRMLVEQGHAVAYWNEGERFVRLEHEAREAGRGVHGWDGTGKPRG